MKMAKKMSSNFDVDEFFQHNKNNKTLICPLCAGLMSYSSNNLGSICDYCEDLHNTLVILQRISQFSLAYIKLYEFKIKNLGFVFNDNYFNVKKHYTSDVMLLSFSFLPKVIKKIRNGQTDKLVQMISLLK